MSTQNENNILPFPDHHVVKAPAAKAKKKGILTKRLYAYGIDIFLVSLTNKLLMATYIEFISRNLKVLSPYTQAHLMTNLGQINFFTLYMVFWGYFMLSLYMGDGRTVGKLIMGLRVKSHEDDPRYLTFQECFMRTLGYFFCTMTGSFLYGIVFLRKDHRGLPDFFSGTHVISESEYQEFITKYEAEKKRKEEEYTQQDFFDHTA